MEFMLLGGGLLIIIIAVVVSVVSSVVSAVAADQDIEDFFSIYQGRWSFHLPFVV